MTIKTKTHITLNPDFPELNAWPWEQLPERFDRIGQLIYNSRNQVRDIDIDGRHVIVKRFRRPPLHQRLDYTLCRPSKAQRAYDFGLRLLALGIDTPTPIAYIETYHCGLYTDGFVVTLPCYDPDLRLLRSEPDTHPELIDSIAQYLLRMHEAGFLHGDPNLSNFLYRPDTSEATGFHITTIDINRSQFIDKPTRHQCLSNMMRLTHIRPLLQNIVISYANLRGWDAKESVKVVMTQLDRFERRKRITNKLKGK